MGAMSLEKLRENSRTGGNDSFTEDGEEEGGGGGDDPKRGEGRGYREGAGACTSKRKER